MQLTETQKRLLIVGGIFAGSIATALAISTVFAKPPEVVPPPEVPPPEIPPPPGIPAVIQVESAPTTVTQPIIWERTANGHVYNVCLRHSAILDIQDGQIIYGRRAYHAYFRVVDAAGKGVPNVPILVWSSPTRDDQGGIFTINGSERPIDSPLRVLTDEEGRIHLWFEYYETHETLRILDERHDFKCCDPVAWEVYYDVVPEECCPPFGLLATVPCWKRSPTASTDPKGYMVHLEVEGAPGKFREIMVSCRFDSKVLW